MIKLSNFRNELFKLCNKILKQQEAQEVGQLIYKMSISKESTDAGKVERNLHGDFV